tara:strand:- start:33 stop:209 length:177 start_codon:yes stop_codon:yes gene_type:complete
MILGELIILIFMGLIYRICEIRWDKAHEIKKESQPNVFSSPPPEPDAFSMAMMMEQDL